LYYESDNTAVLKSLDELSDKITEFITHKKIFLTSVAKGFELEKYLRSRALVHLEEPEKIRSKEKALTDTDVTHPKLYQQLKAWRYQLSNESGVALYSIVSQKSLRLIANELPTTIKQLGSIHGIGKKKLTQHGEDILEVVKGYCHRNNIPQRKDNGQSTVGNQKENTKQITFDLYRQGMDIPTISETRGLTQGTIERHLGYFIQHGELEITELVPEEKVNTIAPLIERNNTRSLTEIKHLAGEEVTYADLHFVINHLKRMKTVDLS
jgi:uncharacterized protein YpbB